MMKKFKKLYSLIAFIILVVGGTSYAQPALFGTTSGGGDNYLGSIYTTDINGNNYQEIFTGESGPNEPLSKPLEVSNGIFYGVTPYTNNSSGEGAIFEYNAITETFTVKHSFSHFEGSYPEGGLIKASNGKLYGLTTSGGTADDGVIYEYDYINEIYTVKHELNATLGISPVTSFYEASNGKLYAPVYEGGTNDDGTILEYDPITNVLNKRADFNSSVNGRSPEGNLIERNGKLYGISSDGGTLSGGVIYEYDLTSFSLVSVANLPTFSSSFCTPILASNDKLYGATDRGGTNNAGQIFEYDFATSIFSFKAQFDDVDLSYGRGQFIEVTTGHLVSFVGAGGANNLGAIYDYDIATNTITILHDFEINASENRESFILGSDGNLYGLAVEGGSLGLGSVYTFNLSSSVLTELYNMGVSEVGYNPMAIIQSESGKLYGLNNEGGVYGGGTLFEMNPISYEIIPLVQFKPQESRGARLAKSLSSKAAEAIDYSSPHGLVEASNGKLYGRTNRGGENGAGVIFEFDPTDTTIVNKVSFSETTGNNGGGIRGGLIEVSGKLYGSTRRAGGPTSGGTIFEYDLSTGSFTAVVDLGAIGVKESASELVLAPNGKLYGTSISGGANNRGTLYEYDIATETPVLKIEFDNVTGSNAFGGLVVAGSDKLLGMTYSGGTNNTGELYEYIPSTNTYSTLASFDINTGEYPTDNILTTTAGKFFGLTSGSFFIFDLSTNIITNKEILTYEGSTRFAPSTLIETCTQSLFDEPASVQLCLGDPLTVNLNSVNTDTYIWKLNGNILTGQTTGSFNITEVAADDAGTYTVELTNSCTTTIATFDVGVSNIVTELIVTDVNCNGETDGSIQATAGGGVAPYMYSIDGVNFQSTDTFNSLSSGNYVVTTKDDVGCLITTDVSITQPDVLGASITSTDITCKGEADGNIIITASGGISPYEYSIDGSNYLSTFEFTSLTPGSYQIAILDANGCLFTEEVALVEPDELSISASFDGSQINITATGGTTPYEYSLDGTTFQSESTFTLGNGSYTFTVRDANGCEASTDQATVITALDLDSNAVISLYPNPAQSQLTITHSVEIKEIRIADFNGKIIASKKVEGNEASIEVNQLKAGVYLMEVIDASGSVNYQRFMKK